MKKALFLVALLPMMSNAGFTSDDLTVGVLANFTASEYASDDKLSAFPLVLYDDDRLYFEGSEAGVYALKNQHHWVRVGLSYEGRSFDPDDAKTQALKGLNKRKGSVSVHASYTYINPKFGGIELKATTDVLDNSDGQTLSLAHRSRFKFYQDTLTIYPKFGLTWYSDDYNNYYYDISPQEAERTGVNGYTAKSGVSPFVAVSARYQFTPKVGLFANQRLEWLSSTQKNSPMVDDNTRLTTSLGLTYDF